MDPFKIIKTYDNYSNNLKVIPNRDFISTEVYLKNRKIYHYNSFIFGSSRTMAYKTNDWRKYIDSTSRPFLFDASGESLFGIYTIHKSNELYYRLDFRTRIIVQCLL